MRKSLAVSALLLTVLVLPSCTSNRLAELQAVGPCFQEEVLPILVSNCAQSGCHNPVDRRVGFDFTNYDGVLPTVLKGEGENSLLVQVMRATGGNRMPPEGFPAVPDEQIDLIAEWINVGAFTDTGCEPESCDSLQDVSFAADVKPIMDLHCAGCHNVDNPTAGFELDTYDQISGLAQAPIFLGTLTGDPNYVPMPWNAPPLSDCKIERVRVWIEEGAQNN